MRESGSWYKKTLEEHPFEVVIFVFCSSPRRVPRAAPQRERRRGGDGAAGVPASQGASGADGDLEEERPGRGRQHRVRTEQVTPRGLLLPLDYRRPLDNFPPFTFYLRFNICPNWTGIDTAISILI